MRSGEVESGKVGYGEVRSGVVVCGVVRWGKIRAPAGGVTTACGFQCVEMISRR